MPNFEVETGYLATTPPSWRTTTRWSLTLTMASVAALAGRRDPKRAMATLAERKVERQSVDTGCPFIRFASGDQLDFLRNLEDRDGTRRTDRRINGGDGAPRRASRHRGSRGRRSRS